jgi:iron complex outermembrane receptor protein
MDISTRKKRSAVFLCEHRLSFSKRSSLRLNIFSGKEKTYQAWYGVPENLLATDRTNNPAGTEKPGAPTITRPIIIRRRITSYSFNHSFNNNGRSTLPVFLTRGKGYYEEYKAAQSYSKYGLPNVVVGSTTVYQNRSCKTTLVRQLLLWTDPLSPV